MSHWPHKHCICLLWQAGSTAACSACIRCVAHAGMAKGKQQLKARLEMLLWALTHSNALSPQASRFLRGKGYLYFPKSSSVRWRPFCFTADAVLTHLRRIRDRMPQVEEWGLLRSGLGDGQGRLSMWMKLISSLRDALHLR